LEVHYLVQLHAGISICTLHDVLLFYQFSYKLSNSLECLVETINNWIINNWIKEKRFENVSGQDEILIQDNTLWKSTLGKQISICEVVELLNVVSIIFLL